MDLWPECPDLLRADSLSTADGIPFEERTGALLPSDQAMPSPQGKQPQNP